MGVCDSLSYKNNNYQNNTPFNRAQGLSYNINNENKIPNVNNNINNNIDNSNIIAKKENNMVKSVNQFLENKYPVNTGQITESNYFDQDTVEQLTKSGFFDKNIEEQLRKSGFIKVNSKEQFKLDEQNMKEDLRKSGITQQNGVNASVNNMLVSSKVLPVQVMEAKVHKPIVEGNVKVLPVIYLND